MSESINSGSPTLPTHENAAAPGAALKRVVQAAHNGLDRIAGSAAPKVQKLGETADQLARTRDDWADGVRNKVRSNPLGAIVGALVLGAVIARITR